jgi:hypothetical protein
MAGSAPAISALPIVRQGSQLIVPTPPPGQPAILPPLCIKCGAPADGKPVERTIYWHHPAVYLLILAGLLMYAIVAIVVRKSIKVRMPLCARHAQRRSIAVTLAWVLPLAGIADAIILPQFNVDGGIVALITAVLVLTGLVLWGVVSSPLRAKSIDQYRGILTGCCQIFLEQFPEGSQMPPVSTLPPQMPPPPPPPIA